MSLNVERKEHEQQLHWEIKQITTQPANQEVRMRFG